MRKIYSCTLIFRFYIICFSGKKESAAKRSSIFRFCWIDLLTDLVLSVFTTCTPTETVFTTSTQSETVLELALSRKLFFTTSTRSENLFGTSTLSETVFGTSTLSETVFGTSTWSENLFGTSTLSETVFETSTLSETDWISGWRSQHRRRCQKHAEKDFESMLSNNEIRFCK